MKYCIGGRGHHLVQTDRILKPLVKHEKMNTDENRGGLKCVNNSIPFVVATGDSEM